MTSLTTKWKYDDDYGYWICGNLKCCLLWCCDDGTPSENEMNYCPKCGLKIDEFIWEGK